MIRLQIQPAGLEYSPQAGVESATIGRTPGVDLVVDNPHVSALHGQLVHRAGRWCYQDLGSKNGSALERAGRRSAIQVNDPAPVELRVGDRILLGSDSQPVVLEVIACQTEPVQATGTTILAEKRLVPVPDLVERLQASSPALAALLALVDRLAAARTELEAFLALEQTFAQGLDLLDLGGVLDLAADTGASTVWQPAAASTLPKFQFHSPPPTDALSLVQMEGSARTALLAPMRVAAGRTLFCLAYTRQSQPTSRDQDCLALASSLLSQRLAQLHLFEELCAARAQLTAKNRYLRERAERLATGELIGRSPAMQALRKDIAAVAVSDATVLISGPSGSGKELVAREIQRRSLRHAEIYATINCGALAEGLLESELFGHCKGAFTGAHRDREGLFEVAHNGTLLLDEIGEMSPGLQVKLLRVLEANEVTPVGATRPRRVDVRVICATHRDLQAEVAAGRFREDLFYRIHVFPIRVPSLEERASDIPLLVEHLLRKCSAENRVPMPSMSAAAMDRLLGQSWPGNVRQLANEIQRAMLMAATSPTIELEHLSPQDDPMTQLRPSDAPETLKDQLGKVERILVQRALADCSGNRTQTARRLGITRQALLAKLKKLDLERG